MGARGFSCAVSGFGQVLKKVTLTLTRFFLAASQLVSSAFGRRRVDEAPRRKREKKPLVPSVTSSLFLTKLGEPFS